MWVNLLLLPSSNESHADESGGLNATDQNITKFSHPIGYCSPVFIMVIELSGVQFGLKSYA